MIAHSIQRTEPLLQSGSSSFGDGKVATMVYESRSSGATSRHNPHQKHSKAAAHRQQSKYEQKRSLSSHKQTLDIIPEEQQHHQHNYSQSPQPGPQQSTGYCHSNTVITTDFWHSMQSLKKSSNSVSLDSLVANNENQSPNESNVDNSSSSNDEDDEDFDNFLDDWEL